MPDKKSEFISVRVDKDTKEKIEKLANEKRWSKSQTVEIIINEYFSREEKFKNILDIINSAIFEAKLEEEDLYTELEEEIEKIVLD